MHTPHPVSRRSVATGLAWAAPAIAATAAAPAFAASSCAPTLRFSGGLTYSWGTVGSTSTTQALEIGGQTYVYGLPAGVTVTTVTYEFWVMNRIGQQSPGPGAFWMGNTTSDKKGTCTTSGCTAAWTPTAGSGFAPTVTNTANLLNKVYPDGTTRASWDLNMRRDASRDANIADNYTTTSAGCRDFTTGPSSRFPITDTGVVGPTSEPGGAVDSYVTITATLSNGQVLTAVVQQRPK